MKKDAAYDELVDFAGEIRHRQPPVRRDTPSRTIHRLKFGGVWLLLNAIGIIGLVLGIAVIGTGLITLAALADGTAGLAIPMAWFTLKLLALLAVCNALMSLLQRSDDHLRALPFRTTTA